MHPDREEMVNALTHGAGAAASVFGAAFLVALAAGGGAGRLLAAVVYGVALVLLYTASTCYHAARCAVRKRRLRVLDHCAIYVFIAASYTPLALGALNGPWQWGLLAVIWSLAAAGVLYKLFLLGRYPRFSTLSYLAMGWLAALALPALLRALDPATVAWIVAGGLAYTVGTLFLHTRRVPYAHGIWHGFVLTGSLCHYLAILGVLSAPVV